MLGYNLTTGNTQSCGCLKSKGELKINQLLTNMKVNFKTQYYFDNCRFPSTNRVAYFDYAIFDNNKLKMLIEYDGPQHEVGWGQKEKSLKEIQERDRFKEEYCKSKKIPLIRISYKDYDKLNEEYLNKIIKEQIETCPATRPEMLEEYEHRLMIVENFAPKLVTDPIEITAMVEATLVKAGVDIETANKGQVMKAIMSVLKGKVDMKIANQVITTLLK